MTSREEYRQHCDAYVTLVRDLCTTPAIRRVLQDGRGRPVTDCLPLHRYLARPTRGHPARRAHYTVACLIAHERPWHLPADPGDAAGTGMPWRQRTNLGAAFARLARARPAARAPSEQRLQTLIRLSADNLHRLLPGTTRLLLEAGCPPDWAVLLDDLAAWPAHRGAVATRWLDAYYLTTPPAPKDT
ncbi:MULTISPECIES: type I-E CRISPR-associated protein Cse2/CasB [Streptomyces]|uniref:type I-E CRISPR-associated protein Cse2/CasB n=1 Tax=Streptomyces TaxID=1883 RepID=UPI0004CD548B|nr:MULTISPECIES: type I-E CRISPR-associated protein Cse2/CasB [Streptomyces]